MGCKCRGSEVSYYRTPHTPLYAKPCSGSYPKKKFLHGGTHPLLTDTMPTLATDYRCIMLYALERSHQHKRTSCPTTAAALGPRNAGIGNSHCTLHTAHSSLAQLGIHMTTQKSVHAECAHSSPTNLQCTLH